VEGAPEAMALAAPTPTGKQDSAVRLGYAANGQAVTYVLGEQWRWDQVSTCPIDHVVLWAREFRYDGARAQRPDGPAQQCQLARR
jgi:hypothetical protein